MRVIFIGDNEGGDFVPLEAARQEQSRADSNSSAPAQLGSSDRGIGEIQGGDLIGSRLAKEFFEIGRGDGADGFTDAEEAKKPLGELVLDARLPLVGSAAIGVFYFQVRAVA